MHKRVPSPFLLIFGSFLFLLLSSTSVLAEQAKKTDVASAAKGKPAPKKEAPTEKEDKITGLYLIGDLAGSYNNPGVRLIGRFGYQWRLFKSDSMAFSNNFLRVGLAGQATPANVGIGLNVAIQPTSFLRFGATYAYRAFFPILIVGTVFKDKATIDKAFENNENWLTGEKTITQQNELTRKLNNGYVGLSAQILRLNMLFQIRIGSIVAQFLGNMQFWFANYTDVDNSEFFYEAGNDLIIKKEDQVWSHLAIAGYEWKQFRFVVAHTYQYAFQSQEEILSLGPAITWTFAPKVGIIKKPMLLFTVRWWLRHRFRSGPMPNFAFILQGEFDVR